MFGMDFQSPATMGAVATTGPVREGSRRRYEERRDSVIDAAARVFAKQGYDATTIDDLVAATGLQRGGLYHYIGGKQDLLIAIHERFLEPLLQQAREIAAQDLEPEPALRALAAALMDNIHHYRDQVTVFFHEWRTIEGDERWSQVRRERREFETIIADVLERGRAGGRVPVHGRAHRPARLPRDDQLRAAVVRAARADEPPGHRRAVLRHLPAGHAA